MAAEDLRPLTPSTFTGILLTREVSFRFGWVLTETESVSAAGEPGRVYQRYQVVHEIPTSVQKPGYIPVGENEWLPESALALTSPAGPARRRPKYLPVHLRQPEHGNTIGLRSMQTRLRYSDLIR